MNDVHAIEPLLKVVRDLNGHNGEPMEPGERNVVDRVFCHQKN